MSDLEPSEQRLQGMSAFDCVVETFGGLHGVARVVSVAPSTVLRWGTVGGGLIPHRHMATLLEAAQAQGKRLTLAEVCFGRPGIVRTVHLIERDAR